MTRVKRFPHIHFIRTCKDAPEMALFSTKEYLIGSLFRGHPRAFREGEVLRQFQDFREKFWSKFGFPNIFYTFSLLP